jgi:hypothetical protein
MADITTMQDLLKLQQDANDLLAKKLEPLRAGKLPPVDDLLADQAADVGRAKEALKSAMKQREVVVKNWDDRINRLRARVDKLSMEHKQSDQLVRRAKKEDTQSKTRTKKRPPRKGRPPNE